MNIPYKSIAVSFFLFFTCNNLTAQDLIDKLSRQLCKCIEKVKAKSQPEMESCFEDLFVNNLKAIKTYYKADTLDDIDLESFGNKIGAKTIKECPYIMEAFPSETQKYQVTQTKQHNLNCDDLKKGDFYYLSERPELGIMDTTFVTISDTMFLERMNNGRTYSLLTIEWKDDCEFDLIFKESNDPMKKELSDKGDVYEYEILTNGETSVFLKTYWMKQPFQFELFKLK